MYSKNEERELLRKTEQMVAEARDQKAPDERDDLDKLRDILRYHEWKYYVKNEPVIPDPDYDSLFQLLKSWEEKKPDWITADSPTQRVGSDLSADFPTVQHLVPMLSLGNASSEEDLQQFSDQIKRLLKDETQQDFDFVSEPKYDGSSLALLYENDLLVRAATRGNGIEGDDITNNVRTLKTVPLRVPFSKYGVQRAELRAEALIPLDDFQKLNEEREKQGLATFANPRNAAAGGLRMKDPAEASRRGIEVIVYQLGFLTDPQNNDLLKDFELHSDTLELLDKLGFKSSFEDHRVHSGLEDLAAHMKEWEAKRSDYPYEIDGMVVKVNQLEIQRKTGSTSHHPRWAIAYKFKAKQATSKLLKVDYQVGKIGTITPVAKIQAVPLAGVTISSVSLHNEEFIRSKDIRIGDRVLVERAGDVIPYIVKPLTEFRNGEQEIINFPEYCPVNDTEEQVNLVKLEDEAAWRCPRCVCGKQDLQKMIFFVSKDAMDMAGLGKSLIERFYRLDMVKRIPDLYRLDYEKVSRLEGFGEKSAANLKKAVEESKNRPLRRLLYSLGIHHLGKRASAIIAAEVDEVWDLKNWEEEDYLQLKDIGPVLAKNMVGYFSDDHNLNLLRELEELDINLKSTAQDKPTERKDGPLSGKSILFTGSLGKFSRKEAQKMAEEAGARNISAVSSKLDILVAGEKAGSKLKKAKELGTVEIMTEDEFVELVERT